MTRTPWISEAGLSTSDAVGRSRVPLGLTAKLFLVVFLGFGGLLAIIVWVIGLQADQAARSALDEALERSDATLATALESRYDDIFETATSLAGDARVRPQVYVGDTASLRDLSEEFGRVMDFDILIFTDADGVILSRSDEPRAVGIQVKGRSHLFDTALNGERAQGIVYSNERLYQMVALPVRDNAAPDVMRGSLAMGYRISARVVEGIRRLTGGELAVFAVDRDPQGQPQGVSQRQLTRPELAAPLAAYFAKHSPQWRILVEEPAIPPAELTLPVAGSTYHGIPYPLERSGGGILGFVLPLHSRSELLRPFMAIRDRVLQVGLVLIVGASLLAWLIAHGVSRPILRLTELTQRIQEGRYVAGEPPKRRDEVGILYRAVYRMSDALRQKDELEDYLANLSDDLDASESAYALAQGTGLTGSDGTTRDVPDAPGPDGLEATQPSGSPAGSTHSASRVHGVNPTDSQTFAGRYRIQGTLGTGAMGRVYLAWDEALNESVALKLIHEQILNPEAIESFKSEIRLARRITHRNVVRTYDFGSADGVEFISMEYVPGFSLDELIRRKGPLEPRFAVMIARQIASALAAAHAEGIIHRDLKPQNMMINRQGVLKVMDFGLAMRVGRPSALTEGGTADGESDSGRVIAGTPNYMAPEQLLGDELDARADIYAVGAILFKVLSGKPPYPQLSPSKRIRRFQAGSPIQLRDQIPSIPGELNDLVAWAMAHDRQDRLPSIRTLQDALTRLA